MTATEKDPAGAPFAFVEWQQKVSVEREYKWSFSPDVAARLQPAGGVAAALRSIGLPAGFRARDPYRHTQSMAYLDDGWQLQAREASLTVVLNTGPTGTQAYLKAKQTVCWHGLRRDAVELAERIDPSRVNEAVTTSPVLPVRFLQRQFAGELLPVPFAKITQDRWKMGVLSVEAVPLMVSWDECRIQPVRSAEHDPEVEARDDEILVHYIDVETNTPGSDGESALSALADAVAAFVGAPPDTLSKSQRAAAAVRHPVA